jgi:hypothetical protein
MINARPAGRQVSNSHMYPLTLCNSPSGKPSVAGRQISLLPVQTRFTCVIRACLLAKAGFKKSLFFIKRKTGLIRAGRSKNKSIRLLWVNCAYREG